MTDNVTSLPQAQDAKRPSEAGKTPCYVVTRYCINDVVNPDFSNLGKDALFEERDEAQRWCNQINDNGLENPQQRGRVYAVQLIVTT